MKDWEPHDPKGERRASMEATLLGILMIFAIGGVLLFLFRG